MQYNSTHYTSMVVGMTWKNSELVLLHEVIQRTASPRHFREKDFERPTARKIFGRGFEYPTGCEIFGSGSDFEYAPTRETF